MTRDETVALFLECEGRRAEARATAIAEGKSEEVAEETAHEAAKGHWNNWAEALIAERRALEASGVWKGSRAYLWLRRRQPDKGGNTKTRAWLDAAFADFSFCSFSNAEAAAIAVPRDANLQKEPRQGQPLTKAVRIQAPRIRFDDFVFPADAWFQNATFMGDAMFANATFHGRASFESATVFGKGVFEGVDFFARASFELATFLGDTSFARGALSGPASFESATFSGEAFFDSAVFSRNAWLEKARFRGGAFFQYATFQNSTSFAQVNFLREARFTGMKVERSFDMTGATFLLVPAFDQADFKLPPDLDDVEFPLPGFWRKGKAHLISQYRAIRRMAIQGADYEREQIAFKGETRSKRGTKHKPWHTAFWFGVAYDALSDFGRSIARPLVIWLASGLAFAAVYLWNACVAVSGWGSACADDGASKALKALTLSAANALPLIGSSRSEVAADFYTKCLALPHVPAWSPILQIWQTLWSAVLLFLFLLALRNQFKIK
jgi:hypothetical protein